MVFRIFGVKIKIEYAFLLMLSVALISGSEGLLYVLLFSSLHEIGHIGALYLLKGKADLITLSFYGIGLKHSSKLSRAGEIIFLCGGCAVNLIFVLLNVKREINFPLFILNILPIYPLDGGRIVKLAFGVNEKPFTYISYSFLFLLLLYSVYIHNINLLLITIYLTVFTFNEDCR